MAEFLYCVYACCFEQLRELGTYAVDAHQVGMVCPSEDELCGNAACLCQFFSACWLCTFLQKVVYGVVKEPLQQLTQLMLHFYGRPNCKFSDREQLIALMQQDKKNERTAQINCTLIRSVGSPAINQIISPAEANEALDYLFSL